MCLEHKGKKGGSKGCCSTSFCHFVYFKFLCSSLINNKVGIKN